MDKVLYKTLMQSTPGNGFCKAVHPFVHIQVARSSWAWSSQAKYKRDLRTRDAAVKEVSSVASSFISFTFHLELLLMAILLENHYRISMLMSVSLLEPLLYKSCSS